MRKRTTGGEASESAEQGLWLDLDQVAEVEVSSEAPGYPIENALAFPSKGEWRAATTGAARITLHFDSPQRIARTLLHFAEEDHERSQEWAISAMLADGSERELLRQGWNFSPGGSREQRESYALHTAPVSSLTLWIDPDRGQNRYPATLKAWQLAADKPAIA